ncbi:hypothetical protein KIPB_012729, partial [Kipferlia bialata]|eukprot:g12729.t1
MLPDQMFTERALAHPHILHEAFKLFYVHTEEDAECTPRNQPGEVLAGEHYAHVYAGDPALSLEHFVMTTCIKRNDSGFKMKRLRNALQSGVTVLYLMPSFEELDQP